MLNALVLIAVPPLLATLLFFERKDDRRRILPVKTALSILFVATAVVQPHLSAGYTILVIIGLIFCLGGDVFLALPDESMFRRGLFSFLAGHVCYIAAFTLTAGVNRLTPAGIVLTAAAGGVVFRWLQPHLGAMRRPVLVYIVVISLMLCGAFSILGMASLSAQGRWLVFAGALCFYVSDIFVARDQFIKNTFINRLAGLPLYYAGQFMIAFSVGLLAG